MLTLAIALLLAAACGDSADPAGTDPPATTTPTTTSGPTPTTTTTSDATTTSSPPLSGFAVGAVQVDLCVVGVAADRSWILTMPELARAIPGPLPFRPVGPTGEGAPFQARVAPLTEEQLEPPPEIFAGAVPAHVVVGGEPVFGEEPLLAGSWDTFPRPVQVLIPDQQVYLDATAAVLADLGIAAAPANTTILRFDIEGDGVDEVLVEAANFEGRPQDDDAYSVLYLRRVVDEQVETTVLRHGRAEPEFEDNPDIRTILHSRIGAVLDANGDGDLELIERWTHFESAAAVLYEFAGGAFQPVAECGSGV